MTCWAPSGVPGKASSLYILAEMSLHVPWEEEEGEEEEEEEEEISKNKLSPCQHVQELLR